MTRMRTLDLIQGSKWNNAQLNLPKSCKFSLAPTLL